MRRTLAAAAVACVGAALLVSIQEPAAAAPARDRAAGMLRQLAAGIQTAPKSGKAAAASANPFTALVPDPTVVDRSRWDGIARTRSAERAAQLRNRPSAAAATAPLSHAEVEPAGDHTNDTPATAEPVTGFGTGRGENPRSHILGQLATADVDTPQREPFAEDDGAIPLAGDPGVAADLDGTMITEAAIGDGPHGRDGDATGDFDFVKITAAGGRRIVAETDTDRLGSPLDTVLGLYDATGELVAANDDMSDSYDSRLRFDVPTTGSYYLMVSGYGPGTVFPEDPFDSASGTGTGSEGGYDLVLTVLTPDRDLFAADLAAGDVLGASVTGAGTRLVVRDPAGREVLGSDQDLSFIYAPSSPLPGGGNAVLGYVAPRSGRYTLEVVGDSGGYDVTFEAYRPGPESRKRGTVQTLFLDFDGARVNTAIWGGPGVRELSPLSAFLPRWGLTADQEDALIDAIVRSVRESLVADLVRRGTNPDFAVRIITSRDHADPFGQPDVHRVIVGGTVAESGISTIGIAQYIDPGNFGTEDSAVVLLDVLSDPTGSASLNTYLTPAGDRIRFIGTALANVLVHEAGHLYGNFHTDTFNDTPNLEDSGGNFPGLFGVGPDLVGGTADDVDYDFGEDVYAPDEGLTGTEDTLDTPAWALTRGKAR